MKRKKYLLLSIILLLIISCTSYHLDSMEEFAHLKLRGRITFIEKDEQWDGFQGNGHKVMIFNIEPKYKNELVQEISRSQLQPFISRDRGFIMDKMKSFRNNKEIKSYLENGEGYYKIEAGHNTETGMVLDLVNDKLIYYYTHW